MQTLLHRNRLIRQIKARPRLLVSGLLGLLIVWFTPPAIATHLATRILIAWNISSILYIVLAGRMMLGAGQDKMQSRARTQDEGKFIVLVLVVCAALIGLVAIFAELGSVKDLHGQLKYEHVALAALTIASSWVFIQIMFAQHYAHDYYLALSQQAEPGLEFPGTPRPDYFDFLYFACVIGTSGQTADVSMRSQHMRRLGLAHCVLAYAFNTIVLALTINIASGLI